MSRHQLGRVTGTLDVPRGPDVAHRVRVPAAWVDEGAIIEFELPRNMKCVACEGGGCDRCDRSGAISVRGKHELAELVQVTLPARGSEEDPSSSGRGLVIRIPQRGGFSEDPDEPRGILMLSVVAADAADPGVVRVELPVAPEEEPEEEVAGQRGPSRVSRHSVRAPASSGGPNRTVVVGVAIIVLLWVVLLLWLRLTGRA